MGLLFIMHGMDGHAAPSAYFGKQVCLANQMVVVAMDWRNFGKTATQEKRGYIGSIETLIQDAEVICEIMAKKYKTQKIFLAGEHGRGHCLPNGDPQQAPLQRDNPVRSVNPVEQCCLPLHEKNRQTDRLDFPDPRTLQFRGRKFLSQAQKLQTVG